MISVVIPTFNRANLLVRAIDSVLNQTIQDFEIIIVNDGSTDDTEEVISKLQSKKIDLITIENNGVSKARNVGILKARGEWIALLDSDDEWLPDKLEQQINFANKNPEIKIIHGEEIWYRNGKRVNQMNKHQKYGGKIYDKCLSLCLISPSSVMIKKEIFNSEGLFNEEFVVCEDYDLWLRLTCKYKIGFIETQIIKKYGGHSDQLSRQYHSMDYWRVLSMNNILKQNILNQEDEKKTILQLLIKTQILLDGYIKHNNLKDLDVIQKIRNDFI